MDRRVYLAARVRPLTPRELSMGSKTCIVVDGNCTTIVNPVSQEGIFRCSAPRHMSTLSLVHAIMHPGCALLTHIADHRRRATPKLSSSTIRTIHRMRLRLGDEGGMMGGYSPPRSDHKPIEDTRIAGCGSLHMNRSPLGPTSPL